MSKPVVVGIDLGGTKTAVVVADLNGTFLARRMEQTETSTLHAALQAIASQIRAALAEVSGAELRAIGVGAPGVAPVFEAIMPLPSVQLAPGWTNIALQDYLQHEFDVPVAIENDVNMAALGEGWRGAGAGVRNLVFVGIGTMIGGGILLNGQVFQGAHGAAGEIGFVVTDPDYADVPPNGEGCMEHYCGGTGIARRAQRVLEQGVRSQLPAKPTAAGVFAAAAAGDEAAQQIVADVTRELGAGIASIIAVLDPDLVIIGGGVAKAGEILFDPIRRVVQRLAPFMPAIVPATLGSDAGVYGAVKLALDSRESKV